METTQIDLSAAIVAQTGCRPVIAPHANRHHILTFNFPDSEEVLIAAARYASGELILPAKHLMSCRSLLFKQMKEGHQ